MACLRRPSNSKHLPQSSFTGALYVAVDHRRRSAALWTFAFDAPALYVAPEQRKRVAAWLRDQLLAHEVPALGPHAEDDGWALSVNAGYGFVFILLLLREGGPCEARVEYCGAAEVEAEDVAEAVEAILAASPALRVRESAC